MAAILAVLLEKKSVAFLYCCREVDVSVVSVKEMPLPQVQLGFFTGDPGVFFGNPHPYL
jgi:hypothetical protein